MGFSTSGEDEFGHELITPRWYAIRVLPQHEKAVSRNLLKSEIETFLPLYRSRRLWSDRVKEIELPLFSSYVFGRFAFRRRVAILRTPGVVSIVSFGRSPAPVADEEIAALKAMVASGLPIQPWPFLRTGQWVRIKDGPLKGLEGILVQLKGSWRVVVSVNLLQRSVAVEVDRLSVTATKDPRTSLSCLAHYRPQVEPRAAWRSYW